MDDTERRTALIEKLAARHEHDNRWAARDFMTAQLFLWTAVISSFATAILAAGADPSMPKLLVPTLAAIPGAVIVIDKSFSFSRRASWHWEMAVKIDQLLNRAQFEGAKVEDISKDLGELRIAMEQKFPTMSTDGLSFGPPGKS